MAIMNMIKDLKDDMNKSINNIYKNKNIEMKWRNLFKTWKLRQDQ